MSQIQFSHRGISLAGLFWHMLVDLTAEYIERLSQRLQALPGAEQEFFPPHNSDVTTLRNLINQHDKHYYIYLDNHRNFAGYGMIRAWEGYDTPTLGCVVWREYRKHGNGAKVVNELVAKARELGYKNIKLKVSPKNEVAYRLYKRVGFRETGEVVPDGRIWMERKTS